MDLTYINGQTRLLALLGHPAHHSISPKMHTQAAKLLGLDYVYLAFDIAPDEIGQAVMSLKLMEARGFNLTMPFKRTVIPYLDHLTKAAKLAGAVNTVINDNGILTGDTTDGYGYMESLRQTGFDPKDKVMTILGAGGAATAIIAQAALDGMKEIRIFKRKNQTFEDTLAFAEKVTGGTDCQVTVLDMADRQALATSIASSDLLTNATNVGMGDDDRSLVDKDMLRRDLVVSDIIYEPPLTPLLAMAKDLGCSYFNGADMLLYQGSASFKAWTGQDMPVKEIQRTCFS